MAHQLALDLGTPPPARLSNFIGNRDAVLGLSHLLNPAHALPGQRSIYLCGELGSGRSHLLAASCAQAKEQGKKSLQLNAHSNIDAFVYCQETRLYTVDDVELLDDARQIAVFNLFNQLLAGQGLVCAGNQVPLGLHVREDLRTRLAWGLVFRLTPLNDEEKITALRQAAQERGLHLSPDVPIWLLKHYRRDLGSLMGVLEALDQFSLEKKRAVTLPLLRELFARLTQS
ncbi:MAG: DnaA regulatory inactivator Hda [Ottowia sp.]|nr:DnaA regulatory inactivator Hda [Ottowia sp.]